MNIYQNLAIAESRHTIHDLCHVCGVTRAIILNYEKHGLIEPIWTNKESGYRYYGAQSVARICHIRALQKLGMSLDDIARYFQGDESTLIAHMEQLQKMREELEGQIARTQAMLTPFDTFQVNHVVLPAKEYVMLTEKCETSQERFLLLWRFTAYVLEKGWQVSSSGGLISILHVKPDGPRTGMTSAAWAVIQPNEESVFLPETNALCVHVKGPYTQIPKALNVLRQYAAEHGLPTDGDIRCRYITSPQSHVAPENYVTSVYLEV